VAPVELFQQAASTVGPSASAGVGAPSPVPTVAATRPAEGLHRLFAEFSTGSARTVVLPPCQLAVIAYQVQAYSGASVAVSCTLVPEPRRRVSRPPLRPTHQPVLIASSHRETSAWSRSAGVVGWT